MKNNRVTFLISIGLYAVIAGAAIAPSLSMASPRYRQEPAALQRNIESFEVNQADVREVLRQLMKMSEVSYTIAPDVQGVVTLSVRNLQTKYTLENILRQVEAKYIVEGDVIHIVRAASSSPSPVQVEVAPIAERMAPTPLTRTIPPTKSETTTIAQDAQFLYIVKGNSTYKVRKSDMKVVAKGKL